MQASSLPNSLSNVDNNTFDSMQIDANNGMAVMPPWSIRRGFTIRLFQKRHYGAKIVDTDCYIQLNIIVIGGSVGDRVFVRPSSALHNSVWCFLLLATDCISLNGLYYFRHVFCLRWLLHVLNTIRWSYMGLRHGIELCAAVNSCPHIRIDCLQSYGTVLERRHYAW